MLKDLGLAMDAARSVGAPLPTGSAAAAVYTLMTQHGAGGKDFSAVYEFFRGQQQQAQPASGGSGGNKQ